MRKLAGLFPVIMGGPQWLPVAQPSAAFSFLPASFVVERHSGTGAYRVNSAWDISAQVARGTNYYVSKTGLDARDGLTPGNAKLTLTNCVSAAAAGSVINIGPGKYGFSDGALTAALAKSLSFIGTGTVIIDTYFSSGTWSATAGRTDVYQIPWNDTTANVPLVADYGTLDAYGVPTAYTSVASIDAVEATAGTFYHDATNDILYTHTLDGGSPDADIRPQYIGMNNINVTAGTFNAYFEGIKFFFGATPVSLSTAGASNFYFKNCTVARARTGHLVAGNANTLIWAQGCYWVDSAIEARDGVNSNGGKIIEINCEGAYIGLTGGTDTNNGSTNHLTGVSVRVNCNYHHTFGPPVADINDTASWNLGVNSHDSLAVTVATQNIAFEAGTAGMWCDGCTISAVTYAFDPSAVSTTIRYRNHTGAVNKTGSGTVTTY